MSIFSNAESGTNFHRSRFTKSISNRMDYDTRFYELVPVLKRFVLPGDVWRISGDVLVRFQPMRTPTLTPNNFRVRYFFVPLRLVEKNTELIITGSNDGHLFSPSEDVPELPKFDNFVANVDTDLSPNGYKVLKHSFWDYMNVQCGDYSNIKNDECLPANYWWKAYERILWDYYMDENLSNSRNSFDTFEDYIEYYDKYGAYHNLSSSLLPKDYFTSSLPWQLKGTAPRVDISGMGTIVPNFGTIWSDGNARGNNLVEIFGSQPSPVTVSNDTSIPGSGGETAHPFIITRTETEYADVAAAVTGASNNFAQLFKNVNISGNLGFNADDIRTMMAQTRIFERLARCGSRYTEYLRSNFGSAPADDTLQRAQYLGGWKVPIVTTEVLQTAGAGDTPVGTMRGHGITRGGNSIATFVAKEFGMIFGLAEVRPDVQYTTGIPRQLSYKSRWDFFNPSLQHLSEQEVRNGELYISETDGKNDTTFGFQAYGNELRTCQNETVGDLRDQLSDWNQALHFNSRPNLNAAFVTGRYHRASFNAPFVVQDDTSYPIIVQFYNNLDVYRPMVRYATPGLIDHL